MATETGVNNANTSVQGELPADDPVESPLFNYHCKENNSKDLQFFVCDTDDPSLPPVSNDASDMQQPNRCSVISAKELDGLSETDFPDQGRLADKPANDVSRIMQQIKNIALFQGYDDDELRLVIDYMFVKAVAPGDTVIKYGSIGDAIYVVKSGKFKCTVPGNKGAEQVVRTYSGDGYFGELALINHAPRAANIIAVTCGELWVLNALRNAWIRKNQAIFNAERFDQVVKAIPLLRDNLNGSLTSRLIDALEVVRMNPGDLICVQGDPGDAMYFIMTGEVDVEINDKSVKVMQKNEYFGERALLLSEGRAATCRAKTAVKLAKLQKENFDLVMPDAVIDKMKQHMATHYGSQSPKSTAK